MDNLQETCCVMTKAALKCMNGLWGKGGKGGGGMKAYGVGGEMHQVKHK